METRPTVVLRRDAVGLGLLLPSHPTRKPVNELQLVALSAQPCQGWGRGFESLRPLQSVPLETFSAIFGTAKKPNCRRHSRDWLGGLKPERYGKSLSEWRSLSEAWGLARFTLQAFS